MSGKDDHLGPKVDRYVFKKKKKGQSITLLEFVDDPRRTVSLVGLQYVVEIKELGCNTKRLVKCNLCRVKGEMETMQDHLMGITHLKTYMEKHYLSLLDVLKGVGGEKTPLEQLLREFANEIEFLEGTSGIQFAYVSGSEFKQEQESWVESKYDYSRSGPQGKYSFSRRKLALLYSTTFRISSWKEASEVLILTQQLSDRLEQYYLKCKELAFLPPYGQENSVNTTKWDMEDTTQELWDTEEPSTSSMDQYNAKYTHHQVTGHESHIPDASGYGQLHVEQKTEYSTQVFHSSSNDNFPNIEVTSGSECPMAPNVTNAKGATDTDDENYAAVPDQSSSHTTRSHEQSATLGKISKPLSPDILMLLKGKDASTVTNILKTLSPFYPALQDVDLDILGLVLVNTGALH